MNDMMLRTTRLTRANRLIEATALIQSMLRGDIDQGGPGAFETPLSRNSDADRRLSKRGSAPEKDLEFVWRLQNPTYAFQHYSTRGLQTWTRSGQFSTTDIVPAGGTFIEACYANAAGSRPTSSTYPVAIKVRGFL